MSHEIRVCLKFEFNWEPSIFVYWIQQPDLWVPWQRDQCSPTKGLMFCPVRHLVATRTRRKPGNRLKTAMRESWKEAPRLSSLRFFKFFSFYVLLGMIQSTAQSVHQISEVHVSHPWFKGQDSPAHCLRPWASPLTHKCECAALSLICWGS